MDKLQVRLDLDQVNDILEALREAAISAEASSRTVRWSQLIAWLTWRRDKFWGSPAGSQAAEHALSSLRDKLAGNAVIVHHGRIDPDAPF